jgi:hypothetical protein
MKQMMKMVVAAALVAAAGASAMAGSVHVDINPGAPWRSGNTNGGGFRVVELTGNSGEVGGRGGSANSFISFCVELNEFIGDVSPNYTSISMAAVNGGVGGGNPDPISAVTQRLYAEFRNGGTFGGLTGLPAGVTAAEWTGLLSDALQEAIWFQENEIGSVSGLAASLHAWASNAANAPANAGNVRILNIFRDAAKTSNGQDLLTLIPLPSAGAMAGVGLLILGARTRRQTV